MVNRLLSLSLIRDDTAGAAPGNAVWVARWDKFVDDIPSGKDTLRNATFSYALAWLVSRVGAEQMQMKEGDRLVIGTFRLPNLHFRLHELRQDVSNLEYLIGIIAGGEDKDG